MNNETQTTNDVLFHLRDPKTIRKQAHKLLKLAKEGQLEHFALDPTKMKDTASYIIDVIMQHYPNLDIPYHSRWRHFESGGVDRIHQLKASQAPITAADFGKIAYELVIISVFLDAGAGPFWRYKEEKTGEEYSRSEGLALASLALYQKGVFSAQPNDPLRVDASRLIEFKEHDLMHGFQVSQTNPLEGIHGRVALLNKLGILIQQKPHYFGAQGRLGDFYTYISSLQKENRLSAAQIFQSVLDGFNEVWPARLSYNGVPLGDVWIHKALHSTTPGSEYIPFHKLSQWLTYSLIEPLEWAGTTVSDLDTLTGLPEYRNGGLLIDCALLNAKDKNLLLKPQEAGSEAIVEWRGLTVALLDELAILIRQQLHKDAKSLPLAKILQGGTWEAGRSIAKQKRPQGTPPIQIISDGTVF